MKFKPAHYLTLRDSRKVNRACISSISAHQQANQVTRSPDGHVLGRVVHGISASGDAHRMNKGEAAYAAMLQVRFLAGEIHWWTFEGLNFRLADNTNYRPDFIFVNGQWEMEAHDVKGRSGDGPWVEEDAMVKIKVAARLYPWLRWKLVWPRKGGGWDDRTIGRGTGEGGK